MFFDLMRSVGPGRCLIDFTDFIKCCNVANSIMPFFLSKGLFVGATSLWCYNKHSSHYIRSLTVALFD